jgi:hypothetical protein
MIKNLLKISKYFALPIVIYLFAWVFYFLGFFDSVFWFDDIFHIIGGFVIGCTYFFVLSYFELKGELRLNKFSRFLFVVSLVMLTAVLYEFYEFFLTLLTNIPTQPSLEDTLFDLFLGLFGGFLSFFALEFKEYIESK